MFAAATKNDARSDRSLCRGELLDFVVRLAHAKFRKASDLRRQTRTIVAAKEPPPVATTEKKPAAAKKEEERK